MGGAVYYSCVGEELGDNAELPLSPLDDFDLEQGFNCFSLLPLPAEESLHSLQTTAPPSVTPFP